MKSRANAGDVKTTITTRSVSEGPAELSLAYASGWDTYASGWDIQDGY